jgi:hypothetical protein
MVAEQKVPRWRPLVRRKPGRKEPRPELAELEQELVRAAVRQSLVRRPSASPRLSVLAPEMWAAARV